MSDELQLPLGLETVRKTAERAPRLNVMLMATVQHARWTGPTTHRVRDLSTRGAKIDKAERLRVGDTFKISIGAAQAIMASVKWVRMGSAGIAFDEEIDIDEARKRVASTPKPLATAKPKIPLTVPTAGWFEKIRDPYRD